MEWQKTNEFVSNSSFPKEAFCIFTFTILSLLLPLSFLLLSTLSGAQYYLQTLNPLHAGPYSFLYSLFFFTNPGVLYVVVSLVSIPSLINGLYGQSQLNLHVVRPHHLYAAWALICSLQLSVCVGIEGCIAMGIDEAKSSFLAQSGSLLFSRWIFFLGLHETTLHWSAWVVRPVVDDALFGDGRDQSQRSIERLVVALSFCVLWWWRLRDEVDSLVVTAEVKRKQFMKVEVSDFVGWCLYYVTVAIGLIRIVKGLIWVAEVLLCGRVTSMRQRNSAELRENDDKV